MEICTLTQITSSEVGFCKKTRKKVGSYKKPKQTNTNKLKTYLNEHNRLGSGS